MKKIIVSLLLAFYSFASTAQIVNPNPPGSVNWTAPGTIGSGTPNSGVFTTLGTTGNYSSSSATGVDFYGTLPYSDTGIIWSSVGSINSYFQTILVNSNSGASASADYIVGNNNNTATTYYGDFGMNSSTFSGTGSLNAPNNVYLTGTSADLAIGTTTANGIHFCINNCAADNLAISSSGVLSGSSLTNYFASPPAIGATAQAYGTFTGITATTSGLSSNNGTAAAPGHFFNSATTTGLYWANPGIGFTVAGSSVGTMTSTGYSGNAGGITGGSTGCLLYQTAANTTGCLPIGTGGYALQVVSGLPSWQSTSGVYNPAAVAITGGTIAGLTSLAVNPSTPTSTEFQVGAGSSTSQGWYMGNLSSGESGIWQTGLTPSSTNFVMAATSSNTYINSSLGDAFYVGGASVFSCSTLCQFQVNAQFTGTNGIIGTTSGNNTAAGNVGEFPTPTNLTGVSLTSNVAGNIGSFSLTAGDWDVWGACEIVPAATTVPQNLACGVSTTSASLGGLGTYSLISATMNTGATQIANAPIQRINISSTTTVYLVVSSIFTVSTETGSGYLFARRVR